MFIHSWLLQSRRRRRQLVDSSKQFINLFHVLPKEERKTLNQVIESGALCTWKPVHYYSWHFFFNANNVVTMPRKRNETMETDGGRQADDRVIRWRHGAVANVFRKYELSSDAIKYAFEIDFIHFCCIFIMHLQFALY